MKAVFTVVFLIMSSISIGQTFEVSSLIQKETKGVVEGVVVDVEADNQPLPFVTVTVKETNTEVKTEINGSYSISLNPGKYTLEFSFIGYNKVEITSVEVTSNNKIVYNQSLEALSLNVENSISQIEK